MNTAEKKVPPATELPKDILVLGGKALATEATRTKADFCACDFVSIMESRPFSDYKAVVYWPDEAALELPGTHAEWLAKKRQNPQWPDIPAEYWTIRDQVRAGATPTVKLSDFPRYTWKGIKTVDRANWLLQQVRQECSRRLREITTSAFNGLAMVCVLPSAKVHSEEYLWITPTITIETEAHARVIPQKIPDEFEVSRDLECFLRDVGEIIPAWPYSISTPLVHTWNNYVDSVHPWLEFFPPQPGFAAAYPDLLNNDQTDADVYILAPYLTADEKAKSLLLLLGSGFILLIPEPAALSALMRGLRRHLLSKPSVPVRPCRVCGWRHRLGDFTEIVHPSPEKSYQLNAEVQARIIRQLHEFRETADDWVDFKVLDLDPYKTPGDAFRANSARTFKLLVEVERKRCRLKSPA